VNRVVVGVDGSEGSKRALRYAREEARLRSANLEAVYIYKPPHRDLTEDGVDLARPTGPVLAGRQLEEWEYQRHGRARRRASTYLTEIVADALEGTEGPKPDLVVAEHDDPTEALLKHAEGAVLLVIGLRRRSPVGKLVMGSHSRDILLRSPVPVLAVHQDG
jgi:nucleotide-binding universal stress UspA family protein